MTQTISLTDDLYQGLQQYAQELQLAPDLLAQRWLRQALQLQHYPELEWRDGPGGRRVGIKGSAIDLYTIVGYVHAGYSPQVLVTEILPQLTPTQIATALRYYAEYPQEIDQILADNEPDAAQRQLVSYFELYRDLMQLDLDEAEHMDKEVSGYTQQYPLA